MLLRLAYPQIPLRKQAHLFFGVAAISHPFHEVLMFALVFLRRFRVEGDHRQQIFGAGEHVLFNHQPQLLVAVPGRVFPVIGRPGPQYEVDHLVAEVFWIADARRLLDFLEFVVQRSMVENIAGIGVAIFLILYPKVSISNVAIKDVLAILGIRLQISRLYFLANTTKCSIEKS